MVDFTHASTWSGMGFTAFVTDVFSHRIVGWRTSDAMPTELPPDALEMACGSEVGPGSTSTEPFITRMPARKPNTRPFATPNDSPTSAVASIARRGLFDNSPAETVIGLCKAECAKINGPFPTVHELELATLSWAHWFNTHRLHPSLGYLTALQTEVKYYPETPAHRSRVREDSPSTTPETVDGAVPISRYRAEDIELFHPGPWAQLGRGFAGDLAQVELEVA